MIFRLLGQERGQPSANGTASVGTVSSPGEGYVQSGAQRLCRACAEIEAKQVDAGEKAFARAVRGS